MLFVGVICGVICGGGSAAGELLEATIWARVNCRGLDRAHQIVI
jgi:hypothetical protein